MPESRPPVHPGGAAGGGRPLTAAEIDAVLADFRAWLEAGGSPEPVEPVGLDALTAELVALRHDVQLHTKAARAAVEKLGPPPDTREAQRPLVLGLIDVAEALRVGLRQTDEAGQALSYYLPDEPDPPKEADFPRPGWWDRVRGRPSPAYLEATAAWQEEHFRGLRGERANPVLAGVSNGYALSLRRADRALAAAGVEPFAAPGDRFDPGAMEAVKVETPAHGSPAEVAAVVRRGYRWRGEVLAFAQVTVSG